MRAFIICLTMILLGNVCFAGLTSIMGELIAPGKPAFAVVLLVGISILNWTLRELFTVFGGGNANGINIILKCVAVGIVLHTVWNLINDVFSVLGI